VYVASLGQMADPVVPPSGWELLNPMKLWKRIVSGTRNINTIFFVRRQLKNEKSKLGWSWLGPWTREAVQQYLQFCQARGMGDTRALKYLTTDEYYKDVKRKVLPAKNNDLKREWDAKDLKVKVLYLRMVGLQEPDAKFAQILFRFTSQQKLKITDKTGALVAGSDVRVPVKEYFVLERPLQDIHLFKWKFIGKLDPDNTFSQAKPML